jgi:hypothetical protein
VRRKVTTVIQLMRCVSSASSSSSSGSGSGGASASPPTETPAELPKKHSLFIEGFRQTAGEGKGESSHDGNGSTLSKRQKILTDDTGPLTAPVARYALGGDDNLYLQLGLSVLHTASDEKLALAPSALYNLDAVHAIQDGMQRNIIAEAKRREAESEKQLENVRLRLMTVFGMSGFNDLVEDGDRYNPLLETEYDNSKRSEFTELLRRLYGALDSELAKRIEIDIYELGEGRLKVPSQFADGLLVAAMVNKPPQKAPFKGLLDEDPNPTDSPVVNYAITRGLCGHRGPMEQMSGCPTDSLLPYDTPRGIVAEVALARGLCLPVGACRPTVPDSFKNSGVEEAAAALACNYAIDDVSHTTPGVKPGVVRDARQVRWLPKGKHAVALASAAALEHATARCGQLISDTGSTLSNDARRALVRARLCLKLKQLDPLHELACAAEDGEVLHHVPRKALVTRPVATIRGKMHFAHDAGHHPAPPVTTVLVDKRWTLDHIRADAEFRKSNQTGVYVYRAPSPSELGYLPITTGAAAARADAPIDASDETYFQSTIFDAIKRILEFGLYYADVPDIKSLEATLNGSAAPDKPDALGTAKSRRSGIWNEMLRDIAISTDRLWTFVRTLSGLIGEDADSLLVTADEASAAAARELQSQRKATNDRIAAFQSKIIESLIGSMMKESGLRLDTSPKDMGESLVVINGETAKQINDLASGESGRPFFEANVALRALTEKGAGGQHKLGEVVAQLNGVVKQLHTSLDAELLSPQIAGASLAELSRPRNSYFVRLREDTTAAIRSAYDKFAVECSLKGMGRVYLWELIEGCDHTLCTRFAEFVGHVLIQNRTSTGISALYSSRQQLVVNASQAKVSLERLLNHAGHYRSTYPTPIFKPSNGETLEGLRTEYFEKHNEQPDTWASGSMASAIRFAQSRYHKNVELQYRPDPPALRPWVQGLNF